MELIILLFVVLLFSVVQSIFGVGLLLFGTPTLLLLGYPYDETLWIILPSSITISLLQTASHYSLVQYKRDVILYTLPFLVLSLVLVIEYNNVIDVQKIVGFIMILIGIIKFYDFLNMSMSIIVKKNIRAYHIAMGVVHGVSNMGGGFLSILMSAIYKDKYVIRVNVAFVYMLFGFSQLAVLIIMRAGTFQLNGVLLIPVALISYFYAGNKLFISKIKDESYQSLITIFILTYGIVLFL